MTEKDPNDANGLPLAIKFTTDSTQNKATQINLGSVGKAETVSVMFTTNAGKVAFESSGDTIAANHFLAESDSVYQWKLNRDRAISKMYVASATASTTVTVTFE